MNTSSRDLLGCIESSTTHLFGSRRLAIGVHHVADRPDDVPHSFRVEDADRPFVRVDQVPLFEGHHVLAMGDTIGGKAEFSGLKRNAMRERPPDREAGGGAYGNQNV